MCSTPLPKNNWSQAPGYGSLFTHPLMKEQRSQNERRLLHGRKDLLLKKKCFLGDFLESWIRCAFWTTTNCTSRIQGISGSEWILELYGVVTPFVWSTRTCPKTNQLIGTSRFSHPCEHLNSQRIHGSKWQSPHRARPTSTSEANSTTTTRLASIATPSRRTLRHG